MVDKKPDHTPEHLEPKLSQQAESPKGRKYSIQSIIKLIKDLTSRVFLPKKLKSKQYWWEEKLKKQGFEISSLFILSKKDVLKIIKSIDPRSNKKGSGEDYSIRDHGGGRLSHVLNSLYMKIQDDFDLEEVVFFTEKKPPEDLYLAVSEEKSIPFNKIIEIKLPLRAASAAYQEITADTLSYSCYLDDSISEENQPQASALAAILLERINKVAYEYLRYIDNLSPSEIEEYLGTYINPSFKERVESSTEWWFDSGAIAFMFGYGLSMESKGNDDYEKTVGEFKNILPEKIKLLAQVGSGTKRPTSALNKRPNTLRGCLSQIITYSQEDLDFNNTYARLCPGDISTLCDPSGVTLLFDIINSYALSINSLARRKKLTLHAIFQQTGVLKDIKEKYGNKTSGGVGSSELMLKTFLSAPDDPAKFLIKNILCWMDLPDLPTGASPDSLRNMVSSSEKWRDYRVDLTKEGFEQATRELDEKKSLTFSHHLRYLFSKIIVNACLPEADLQNGVEFFSFLIDLVDEPQASLFTRFSTSHTPTLQKRLIAFIKAFALFLVGYDDDLESKVFHSLFSYLAYLPNQDLQREGYVKEAIELIGRLFDLEGRPSNKFEYNAMLSTYMRGYEEYMMNLGLVNVEDSDADRRGFLELIVDLADNKPEACQGFDATLKTLSGYLQLLVMSHAAYLEVTLFNDDRLNNFKKASIIPLEPGQIISQLDGELPEKHGLVYPLYRYDKGLFALVLNK